MKTQKKSCYYLYTQLVVALLVIILCPETAFSQFTCGYDAYTDWQSWARLHAGYTAGLASSYDRTDGNSDFSYYEDPTGLQTTAGTVTTANIQGPGAIYRFWMPHYTANRNFVVRMYFDGESTPRIDTDSLTLFGGAYSYFAAPLVDTCAGGQVCYEPIFFRDSLKIETENKALPAYPSWEADRHYYQYTYMTLPAGTDVNSYTSILTPQQQTDRNSVASMFNNAGNHPAGSNPAATTINTPSGSIGAGSNTVLADLTGPGIIRKINIAVNDANDVNLEGLRLQVYYDSDLNPAIDISLANFFGAGKDRALYKSLPIGTDSPDGFYCYWPMPFRNSVLLRLSNSTGTPILLDSAIVEYESQPDVDDSCYLYVTENTSVKQSGDIYHQILSANDTGHYVGSLLYIEQDSYSFSMLEGDEVVTIDGTNTLYGTGLEDAYSGGYYYNWVARINDEPQGPYPQSATRPLSGILYVHRESGVSYARADQYRWQIADCIPFYRSLDVKIENRYAVTGARWTSVAFWYRYPCPLADFDDDCSTDLTEFAALSLYWLKICQEPLWCDTVDLNYSQQVNLQDLLILLDQWR